MKQFGESENREHSSLRTLGMVYTTFFTSSRFQPNKYANELCPNNGIVPLGIFQVTRVVYYVENFFELHKLLCTDEKNE